jgi:ADP-ribose pyrophosphatase YjhB (NUDIX family)
MKFCSKCGSKISIKIPVDDNRLRAVCDICKTIHYENPKIVVGCLPIWKDKILLCKRAIEPKLGFWTLPAGFMELHESTADGAMRETIEESGAIITLGNLFTVFDLPFCNQVHMFFLAKMLSPELNPGSESLEAKLFSVDQIPWPELSFTSVRKTLELFISKENKNERNLVHTELINIK